MIKIINVSGIDAPRFGLNTYRLMINTKTICEFEHDRQPKGLPECLRDAADAVEALQKAERNKLIAHAKGITLDECEPKLDD